MVQSLPWPDASLEGKVPGEGTSPPLPDGGRPKWGAAMPRRAHGPSKRPRCPLSPRTV